MGASIGYAFGGRGYDSQIRASSDGRRRLLAVHRNRFLIHVVMRCLDDAFLKKSGKLDGTDSAVVKSASRKAFDDVLLIINGNYPDAYLANLFKNVKKCKDVAGAFKCPQQNSALRE